MIRQFFDFRGVLSGRQYAVVAVIQFFGSIALGLIIAAALILAGMLLHLPSRAIIAPAVVLIVGEVLWTWAAITAKRLRDVGVRPLIGVPVWFAVQTCASFTADRLHPLPANTATYVVGLSTYIALCRLPSAGASRPPSSDVTLEPVVTHRRQTFGLRH